VLFHEGTADHIHISIVAKRAILLVIFDDRSSLGLVRPAGQARHSRDGQDFRSDAAEERKDGRRPAPASPFAEITDDDIDALFSE
jgi:hypothetical protein